MNIFLLGNKIIQYVVAAIAFIIILFLHSSMMFAQNTIANSDKLKLFEGEWKLKDNVWKSKSDSVYKEDVNPNRSFVAKAVSPENTLLWEEDFDNGAWATLLWTYHWETGRVNHISNTTDNNIGIGVGEFDNNNDLTIRIVYPNGCTNCHRIYTFHWIEAGEFDFKATIYKDDKPTGDFYGGTFIRKAGSREEENSVKFVEIGVNVSDTSRSLDFYTKVIGMRRVGHWHVSKEMSAAADVNSGRAFDLVILQLDCDGYVLNYKLNQTENNPDTTATNAQQYFGFEKPGLGYLTFNVKNVDPYIERIKGNNINYKLVTLPNVPRVVLLHDPDGSLLEIYERK
jgi:catechol 2,3-dioxygenase-like lactoylglutathione lyase family enzyme